MHQEERDKLLEHETAFEKHVRNFEDLSNIVVERNVITDGIKDYIFKADKSVQKREFFASIVKRGPAAFTNFICCLRDTNNDHIADLLVNSKPGSHAVESSVKKGLYKMDYDHEKSYRMRSQPKGYALIINIFKFNGNKYEPRLGSDKDVLLLENLFTGLGYRVLCDNTDLTADGIFKKVKEFSRMKEHYSVDSCVVFIMSHGHSYSDKSGVSIVGSDNNFIHSHKLMELFTVSHCVALATKPKLFFFQACRGNKKHYGVHLAEEDLKKLCVSTDSDPNSVMDAPPSSDLMLPESIAREPLDIESNDNPPIDSSTNEICEERSDYLSINSENGQDQSAVEPLQNGHSDAVSSSHVNGQEDLSAGLDDQSDNTIVDSLPFTENESSETRDALNRNGLHNFQVYNNGFYTGNSSDIMIVYSAHPGYCSLRDEHAGAWLVQEMYKIFSEDAYVNSLYDMLLKVKRNIEKRYSPNYGYELIHIELYQFKKKLFFNPGLYH